ALGPDHVSCAFRAGKMTRVNLPAQVLEFCGSLAPEPRKKLRQALRNLEKETGDINSLEGPLAGYHRMRSGSYRVISARRLRRGRPGVDCLLAGHRALVCEVFPAALARSVL